MNELPHRKAVLESVGLDDVFDNLRSEAVSCTAPQRGQSKLSIHVHLRLFQKAFPRVIELANKRKIEFGLPFLNESQLHGSKVTSSSEQGNWAPDEQVVVILPISKRELGLHQFVILKL